MNHVCRATFKLFRMINCQGAILHSFHCFFSVVITTVMDLHLFLGLFLGIFHKGMLSIHIPRYHLVKTYVLVLKNAASVILIFKYNISFVIEESKL